MIVSLDSLSKHFDAPHVIKTLAQCISDKGGSQSAGHRSVSSDAICTQSTAGARSLTSAQFRYVPMEAMDGRMRATFLAKSVSVSCRWGGGQKQSSVQMQLNLFCCVFRAVGL